MNGNSRSSTPETPVATRAGAFIGMVIMLTVPAFFFWWGLILVNIATAGDYWGIYIFTVGLRWLHTLNELGDNGRD